MKKIFLKIVAVVCMAFFASLSAFAVGGPEPVELRVSIKKPKPARGDTHKSPFRFPLRQIPTVSLDGHTLYFDASCSGCTLQLVDEDDVVVYDVTIPAGATELELPATISGNFVLQFICGRYCYWGWGPNGNNGYFLSNVLNAEESPVYNDDGNALTRSSNFRYKLATSTFVKE